MTSLFASVGHNLRRLPDFSGRESRALFWPYILLLFGLAVLAAFFILVPPLLDMLVRIQRAVIEHPEDFQRHFESGAPGLPPELMPDFSGIMLPMGAVNLVFVLLAAAAVARRLHDRDRTGLWGLLPLPFMAIGQAAGPASYVAMSGAAAPGATSVLLMLNGMLSWGALIVLVIFLAGPGTAAPNRYGPPPSR